MNKQMWNLYKESDRGKKCIEMFNPEIENTYDGIKAILDFSEKWEDKIPVNGWLDLNFLFEANLPSSGLLPEDGNWTREKFNHLIEEYQLIDATEDENGEIKLYNDAQSMLLPKNKYRQKATFIPSLSLFLFYSYTFFKPLLLPTHFDVIQKNCDALSIELPPIPRSKDYKAYLMYYYDICSVWNDFQEENKLTDAECCACIYDYAILLQESHENKKLPRPTNVWLTGASDRDFTFLDSLGKEKEGNGTHIWACNERTRRGDIIIIYCTSPRSYIHSIWRANSEGIFNPFDYYHCRTTVCDGILTPHISFKDLKADSYFAEVPIIRKNLQGINGVELNATDYSELLRMIQEKGGDTELYPKLFDGKAMDFGEINLEKDVEEKILIPMLKLLGYNEKDWTRQLSQKAGRGLKAIPDFVFFPKGEKHFASAPMVIEAKLDMSLISEQQNAFSQGLSYARMLRSSIMGICDKERLILYQVDKNGIANRSTPLFEEHWLSIYGDAEVGAKLNKLIGREVITRI